MPDLNDLHVKERNAEYFYESFERFYRQGDYTEACQSLWKAALTVIAGIASFENKEIKTIAEAKAYLQKFVLKGEISASEVSALECIYLNRLRNNSDESMLAIHLEKVDNLMRKLKKILRDYIMNGPGRETSQSVFEGQNVINSQEQTPRQEQNPLQQDYFPEGKEEDKPEGEGSS